MSTTYSFGFEWPKDTILIPNYPHPLIWSCVEDLELILPTLGIPHVAIKVIKAPYLPSNVMIWAGNIYLFDEEFERESRG